VIPACAAMPYKVPVASLMGILSRSLSIAVMTSVIVTELKANAEMCYRWCW